MKVFYLKSSIEINLKNKKQNNKSGLMWVNKVDGKDLNSMNLVQIIIDE